MELPVYHCHDHVFMMGQDTELSVLNGKDQVLAFSLVKNLIAGYNLQKKCVHLISLLLPDKRHCAAALKPAQPLPSR